jgi:hypothetical protein
LFELSEVVEDIFGVVQFFGFEVSFEQSRLESVPELDFVVLYH